jgi:hypothetical protein
MFLNTDYIEPSELTGYAREALADLDVNEFQLSQFLPNQNVDDIDYRFTRGGEGLAEAATFRNYDTPSRFGGRPGATRVSGSLPPISRQVKLGEYDRLKLRQADDDAVVNAIFDDARRMVRAVAARMELARGEALVNAQLSISEGGVVATVDYDRNAGNTVTAGTSWETIATSTPLTNMIAWADTYETNSGGRRPEVALTSRRVLRLLTRSAEIIDAVKGAAAGATRVTLAELNELLESEGLPRIETYDAQVSVGGSATRVIAEDKFLYLPGRGESNQLGGTFWGTTSESLEPEYGLEGEDRAGIVAGVYKQPNPVAHFTNAAGIGLPVLANPDLTFTADVAAF